MKKEDIKNHLLNAGVKNLKEFGYPNVNTENILTDEVYSKMFESMLRDNKGHSTNVDEVIEELLKEIKSKSK